jgi:hypothetical protein
VRALPHLLGPSIVCGVLIALGGCGLGVGALVVAAIVYVATPIAALERVGVGASIRRSAELTRGSRWPIFGALLLVGAIHFGTDFLLAFVAATQRMLREWTWIHVSVTLLLAPFGAILPAVAYGMLRAGKESVDARRVAAVFD